MKRTKHWLVGTVTFFACAFLYCPVFHAMPKFMERYNADPYAKTDLKGRCTICHTNEEGFGPLTGFGKAFADRDYRITAELRQQAPEMFALESAGTKPAVAEFDVKAYFEKNCASCHGSDGKGSDGMMGIPKFTDQAWQQRRTDEKLIEVISKGKGQMPSWKEKLTEEQIKLMVAFIRKFPDQR